MYELVVCDAAGNELRRFDLAELSEGRVGGRVLIGRAEDCGVRLRVGSVSRHHCAIERDEDGQWIVRDLGSTHGTLVNDARIEQATIEDHLHVRVGPAVIRFEPTALAMAQRLRKDIEAT